MKTYKCDAIVLRSRDFEDADRLVTLFSRQKGKIVAIAKGARRPRNRLAAATQLFSCGNYMLFQGSKMDTINQCEQGDCFRPLQEDLAKMAYGTYVAELLDELAPEHEVNEDLYDLLLHTFRLFSQRNPRVLSIIFTLQCLTLTGFQPSLACCVSCGKQTQDPTGFDIASGGIVCPACALPDTRSIEPGLTVWMHRLIHLDLSRPPQFSLPRHMADVIENILHSYVHCRIDKPLKSLNFLRSLQQVSCVQS